LKIEEEEKQKAEIGKTEIFNHGWTRILTQRRKEKKDAKGTGFFYR
jgi:hypothetical protein